MASSPDILLDTPPDTGDDPAEPALQLCENSSLAVDSVAGMKSSVSAQTDITSIFSLTSHTDMHSIFSISCPGARYTLAPDYQDTLQDRVRQLHKNYLVLY